MLSNVEHDMIVSSAQKDFGIQDAVMCSDNFLSVRNNPEVLNKSTEYAKPFLYFVFTIPMNLLLTAVHQYGFLFIWRMGEDSNQFSEVWNYAKLSAIFLFSNMKVIVKVGFLSFFQSFTFCCH